MAREQDVLKALANVRVLVVDDDAHARSLLEALLVYCGAFVTIVSSASAAIDHVRAHATDVVVADVAFSDGQGYALVRELGAKTPMVALAHRSEDGPDRTLAAGFHAHLRKPVDPWELCRVIAELARKA